MFSFPEEVDQKKAKVELPACLIRKVDMREDLLDRLKIMSLEGLKKHKLQKDVAQHIKHELDTDPEFNELIGKGPWQVIVGRSFASAIAHEGSHLAFFDIIKYHETILVYKSVGVQGV